MTSEVVSTFSTLTLNCDLLPEDVRTCLAVDVSTSESFDDGGGYVLHILTTRIHTSVLGSDVGIRRHSYHELQWGARNTGEMHT